MSNTCFFPFFPAHFHLHARRALCRISLMLAIAPIVALAPSARADNWTGNGADNLWGTANNWDAGAPTTGSLLNFTGTNNLSTSNNIASGTVFGGITFDTSAGSFTLAGNSLTPGGDIVDNSTNAQTISSPSPSPTNRNLNTAAAPTHDLQRHHQWHRLRRHHRQRRPQHHHRHRRPRKHHHRYACRHRHLRRRQHLHRRHHPRRRRTRRQCRQFPRHPHLRRNPHRLLRQRKRQQPQRQQRKPHRHRRHRPDQHATAANNISISSGHSFSVQGGVTVGLPTVYTITNGGSATTSATVSGDTFTVNGAANNFQIGIGRTNAATGTDPKSVVDMSGLSNFTYTGTTGQFVVGGGNVLGTLSLANAANTITAAAVRIGDSTAGGSEDNNPNNGSSSLLHLGKGTNVINTTALTVGNDKSGGTIDFQDPALGSLAIADAPTGGHHRRYHRRYLASTAAATRPATFPCSGHNVTVQAGNVTIGQLAGGGTSAYQLPPAISLRHRYLQCRQHAPRRQFQRLHDQRLQRHLHTRHQRRFHRHPQRHRPVPPR